MKDIIKWILIISVLCAIAWMANASFKKIQTARLTKEKLNTLPEFILVGLDSVLIEFSSFENGPLVLIYFNSECDHCQYEVQDIKKNIAGFSKATVVFMSSESLAKINAFAQSSGLKDFPNVFFTKISSNDAFTAFGPLGVPHVFIYGRDKVLRKEFKGETSAEVILKYLN